LFFFSQAESGNRFLMESLGWEMCKKASVTGKENSPRRPQTASGQVLKELEDWLHNLPGTSVDILRLAGLVGPSRHPGRFFAGKSAPDGQHVVNLVHLQDVV
ncbi:hypothetical protein, partial [Pseudomonas aeruginosa]|uniref:hypothetical protein n=1 Tax=Pseudomonas aeruginosa TaxID=287 RepID=UPI001CA5991C